MMRALSACAVALLVMVSVAGCIPMFVATATPYPTYTPLPTYTLVPTATPVPPTATPYPTYTPLPTYTPFATYTPVPTATPVSPTPTAMPTSTPSPVPSPTGPPLPSCADTPPGMAGLLWINSFDGEATVTIVDHEYHVPGKTRMLIPIPAGKKFVIDAYIPGVGRLRPAPGPFVWNAGYCEVWNPGKAPG